MAKYIKVSTLIDGVPVSRDVSLLSDSNYLQKTKSNSDGFAYVSPDLNIIETDGDQSLTNNGVDGYLLLASGEGMQPLVEGEFSYSELSDFTEVTLADNGESADPWVGSIQVRSGNPVPYAGAQYLHGQPSPSGKATLDVDVSGLGMLDGRIFILEWRQTSYEGMDLASLNVVFYDADTNEIGRSGYPRWDADGYHWKDNANFKWCKRTTFSVVPDNTMFVKIELSHLRLKGTNTDSYVDDIHLFVSGEV